MTHCPNQCLGPLFNAKIGQFVTVLSPDAEIGGSKFVGDQFLPQQSFCKITIFTHRSTRIYLLHNL